MNESTKKLKKLGVTLDTKPDWLEDYRWTVSNFGYVRGRLKPHLLTEGRELWILLHRELMGLKKGEKMVVDHINRNKLDNRLSNLRVVSYSTNSRNRLTPKGKDRHIRQDTDKKLKKSWRGQIKFGGIFYSSPYYKTKEEARVWVKKKKRELSDDEVWLNL